LTWGNGDSLREKAMVSSDPPVSDSNTDTDTDVEIYDLPRTPVDPREPPHVLLHMPQNARSVALGVITVLAVLAVLRWASGFFIPLMVGLVFSYALSPVVDWLQRHGVARVISSSVLILGILGGMGAAVYSLSDDANELIASLPDAARKVRDVVRRPQKQASTLDTM
jgi:AI-2E family transporter